MFYHSNGKLTNTFYLSIIHLRLFGLFPVWDHCEQSCLGIEIAGHLAFLRTWQTLFPKQLPHFTFPPAKYEGPFCSVSSPTLVIVCFFHHSLPNGCEVVSCGFLNFIFHWSWSLITQNDLYGNHHCILERIQRPHKSRVLWFYKFRKYYKLLLLVVIVCCMKSSGEFYSPKTCLNLFHSVLLRFIWIFLLLGVRASWGMLMSDSASVWLESVDKALASSDPLHRKLT
jgi:hypothetical protein